MIFRTGIVLTASLVTIAGSAHADEPDRRADVALHATPAAVSFPAQGGSGTVWLDYSNPGNVPKHGSELSAEIPAGVTVHAEPVAGWECHLTDWPALVCSTGGTLRPGQAIRPVRVTITAQAAVRTRIEFGTLGFYRDPTENPADNYSTVSVTAR